MAVWKPIAIVWVGHVLAGVAGCASNPVTGSPELALVSEAELVAQAETEYRREIYKLRSGGYLIESRPDIARVHGVTERLAACRTELFYMPECPNGLICEYGTAN